MTATAAISAYGTTFKWNGATIAEVIAIGEPGFANELIDSTHFSSPDHTREFIAGWSEGDEISVQMNFIASDTAGQIAFITDARNGTKREVIITGPDGAFTWTFDAVPRSFKPSFDLTGRCLATATVKISSAPTLGITASTGLTTPFFVISESAVVTPDEAGDVYLYNASVLTDIASVTVTPTAAAGVIKVNGNTVTSGAASSAITLGAAGTITTITITVTETSKVAVTYTINLFRAAS